MDRGRREVGHDLPTGGVHRHQREKSLAGAGLRERGVRARLRQASGGRSGYGRRRKPMQVIDLRRFQRLEESRGTRT